MPADSTRRIRPSAADTQRRLLETAERLFAERGVHAVSNRQVAEAAGQGSNSAVGYHIGTKSDLIAAIVGMHAVPMDRLRDAMVRRAAGSTELRDHAACLVLPLTSHLADLGVPSWYARFAVQVTADPALRVTIREATATPALRRALAAIHEHSRDLPAPAAMLRGGMVGNVIMHACAEREQALADGLAGDTDSWAETGRLLIDAVTGLLTAEHVRH